MFIASVVSAPAVLDIFEYWPGIMLVLSALGHTNLWALDHPLVGVGAVREMLAWADAADEPGAAARTLGVLRVWRARAADYSPLVQSVLPLPRLFSLVDALLKGERPAPADADGEGVLLALMDGPHSVTRLDPRNGHRGAAR